MWMIAQYFIFMIHPLISLDQQQNKFACLLFTYLRYSHIFSSSFFVLKFIGCVVLKRYICPNYSWLKVLLENILPNDCLFRYGEWFWFIPKNISNLHMFEIDCEYDKIIHLIQKNRCNQPTNCKLTFGIICIWNNLFDKAPMSLQCTSMLCKAMYVALLSICKNRSTLLRIPLSKIVHRKEWQTSCGMIVRNCIILLYLLALKVKDVWEWRIISRDLRICFVSKLISCRYIYILNTFE